MIASMQNHWNIENKRNKSKKMHCNAWHIALYLIVPTKNKGNEMQAEFTELELTRYFKKLTPAEKSLLNIEDVIDIQDHMGDHFEDFDTISLVELMIILKE